MTKNKDAVQSKVKRLSFDLQSSVVTKDASGSCFIEGYANTSSKDRVGDVVHPEAFADTIETYMKNPVLLVNHDWGDPCGSVQEAKITDKGLWIKAMISNTREDIKTLVREKCLRTFSIGYNEIDADYDEATKTKHIKKLELLEISVVTVPANTEAMFTEVTAKAESEKPAEKAEESEKSLKVRSASELTQFIEAVSSAVDRKIEGDEIAAICKYFTETKEEIMTKQELIDLLKKKSAPIPAAAEEAKAEAGAPAEAAPAQAEDPMKAIMSKLDMIGQALAKLFEMMEAPAQAEAEEGKEAGKEEAEAPAEEAAESEEEKGDEAEEDSEEEMSEEEVEKQIQDINESLKQIEELEDVQNV